MFEETLGNAMIVRYCIVIASVNFGPRWTLLLQLLGIVWCVCSRGSGDPLAPAVGYCPIVFRRSLWEELEFQGSLEGIGRLPVGAWMAVI